MFMFFLVLCVRRLALRGTSCSVTDPLYRSATGITLRLGGVHPDRQPDRAPLRGALRARSRDSSGIRCSCSASRSSSCSSSPRSTGHRSARRWGRGRSNPGSSGWLRWVRRCCFSPTWCGSVLPWPDGREGRSIRSVCSSLEPAPERRVHLGPVEQLEVAHPVADPLVGLGERQGQLRACGAGRARCPPRPGRRRRAWPGGWEPWSQRWRSTPHRRAISSFSGGRRRARSARGPSSARPGRGRSACR